MSACCQDASSNLITSNAWTIAQLAVLQATKALDGRSSGPVTLMTLPPEIRNRIYMFVLGPRDIRNTIQVVMSAAEFAKRHERIRSHYPVMEIEECSNAPRFIDMQFLTKSTLNILLACKHVYIEAFHVFYTYNRFYFPDTELLFSFLKGIGYNRRQHLTMIVFDWCGPFAKEAFRLLKTCRRLKSIQLKIPCSEPPGYGAVREIRGLEQALVLDRLHYGIHQLRYPVRRENHYRLASEDYRCLCYRDPHGKGPLDDVHELERAMMRPRLKRYAEDPSEKFNLFEGKREFLKKSEESILVEDRGSWYQTAWPRTRPPGPHYILPSD